LDRIGSLSGSDLGLYSDVSFGKRFIKSGRFFLKNLVSLKGFRDFRTLFEHANLKEVIRLHPEILEKWHSPYVCADWNAQERQAELMSHFSLLSDLFGKNTAKIFKPEGLRLYNFTGHDKGRYSVELFPGYQNEGALGIRICDSERREVYALSLHLSRTSETICYIGALQGPNDRIPDRNSAIVSITRGLHGLRPKALLIESLYMIAPLLNIERIYGVSNAGNIYTTKEHGCGNKKDIFFDRDALWREYLAEPVGTRQFLFPKHLMRKDIAALKPNKRSMYRKRYSWLENAGIESRNTIREYLNDHAEERVLSAPQQAV